MVGAAGGAAALRLVWRVLQTTPPVVGCTALRGVLRLLPGQERGTGGRCSPSVGFSRFLSHLRIFVELDGYTCGTAVDIACAASPKPAETTMVAAPLPSADKL